MKVTVTKEEMPAHLTGGEYATCDVNIFVDPRLPIEEQRLLIIHAVIENYCRSWCHEKVEQLCEFIDEGLVELE